MKKLMIIPVAAASLFAMAGPASAHTPSVSSKCDKLTVELTRYENQSTVVVTVDGESQTIRFDGDYKATFQGTKSWSVKVDNNGEGYDATFSGEFVDCTPPTTTSTTVVPAPPVQVTQTRGVFGYDCADRSAFVQFVNDGDLTDRVTVAGHEVDVPANGFSRINLDRIGDNRFTFGPVASLVNNAPIKVERAPEVDGTGAVNTDCVYLDTQVQDRTVPSVLAFTGAGRAQVLGAVAAVLIFFGAMSVALSHRLRKIA